MSKENAHQPIKVVIAGGGTAGWVTAAVLSAQIGGLLDITLVESDSVGTIGVGEATIPTHKTFHSLLGVDEAEFMRETKATFKLAIAFEDWGALGERYVHPFGSFGQGTWMTDFHSMWRQAQDRGFGGEFDDYCVELQAAEKAKFGTINNKSLNHAYHLDSGLYAKYLRKKSEQRGVTRLEGFIDDVSLDSETGEIKSLKLDDGRVLEGDLFIDCTGFRALLIGKALGVKHIDFGKWLRVNRAIAVQTEQEDEILPYTRCMAQGAGWQWRIPLQHRVGNGHVYAGDYMDDDEALTVFTDNLSMPMCSEPNFIKFKTGRLERIWEKNCVAIGLSSGFLEPLESTSIHLIQIIASWHSVLRGQGIHSTPIGVGEGTWPSMRLTLSRIGVSERDFLKQTGASFKQGTKFKNWRTGQGDYYYHPFDAPVVDEKMSPVEAWKASGSKLSFAMARSKATFLSIAQVSTDC